MKTNTDLERLEELRKELSRQANRPFEFTEEDMVVPLHVAKSLLTEAFDLGQMLEEEKHKENV